MWFGKDFKNVLTSWVYFSCNNYCCVKEKQTTKSLPNWVAHRFKDSPSRQDILRLTVSALGLKGETWRLGWLDGWIRVEVVFYPIMDGCRLSAGTPSHVSLAAPVSNAALTCPHRSLSMWGLVGLLYRKAGEFHWESKREAGRSSCAIFYELAVKSMSHSKHIVCISSSNAKNAAGVAWGWVPCKFSWAEHAGFLPHLAWQWVLKVSSQNSARLLSGAAQVAIKFDITST